jgi:hypothetical protein
MTRNVLLVFAKLVLVTAALGQAAAVAQNRDHLLVYGTFSPLYAIGATTGEVSTGFLSSSDITGSFWAPGVGGGITWNFVNTRPLTLGIDLRGSTKPGTPGADTAMIGFRIAGCSAYCVLKPYGQISFGYLGTRAKNTSPGYGGSVGGTFSSQYVAFEVLGGVDYSLRQHLDLRVIEIGVGKGDEFSLFVTNPSSPTILTVNTGVVFHF